MRNLPVMSVDAYVALGSSSTCGAGASSPKTNGYVSLLTRALEAQFPGIEASNLGHPGGRMQDMLREWDKVRALRPSMVTVLAFRDFAQTPLPEFEAVAQDLFRSASRLAEQRIREGGLCHLFFADLRIDPTFIAGAKGRTEGPSYRAADFAKLCAKNEVLQRAAQGNRAVTLVPVIDQNAVHPEWVGRDGHPNDLGHGYLAGCFRKSVEGWWASLAHR